MSIKVLFLSAETQHTQISLLIKKQLELILNTTLDCEIFDTQRLGFKQPSLVASYKREIEMVKNIMAKFKPDLLVVSNDQGIHSAFIRISRLMNIPSLTIQDGILTERKCSDLFWFSEIAKIFSLAHFIHYFGNALNFQSYGFFWTTRSYS